MTPLPTLRQKLDIVNIDCPGIRIRVRTGNILSVFVKHKPEDNVLGRIEIEIKPVLKNFPFSGKLWSSHRSLLCAANIHPRIILVVSKIYLETDSRKFGHVYAGLCRYHVRLEGEIS